MKLQDGVKAVVITIVVLVLMALIAGTGVEVSTWTGGAPNNPSALTVVSISLMGGSWLVLTTLVAWNLFQKGIEDIRLVLLGFMILCGAAVAGIVLMVWAHADNVGSASSNVSVLGIVLFYGSWLVTLITLLWRTVELPEHAFSTAEEHKPLGASAD